MAKIHDLTGPGELRHMSADEIIFPNGVPEDVQRRHDEAMRTIDEMKDVDTSGIVIRSAGSLLVESQTMLDQ